MVEGASPTRPGAKRQAVGEARTPKRLHVSGVGDNLQEREHRENGAEKKSSRRDASNASALMDKVRREDAGAAGTTSAADSERCRRNDGKNWRCPEKALPGHKHCQKHLRTSPFASAAQAQKRAGALSSASQPSSPLSLGSRRTRDDGRTSVDTEAAGAHVTKAKRGGRGVTVPVGDAKSSPGKTTSLSKQQRAAAAVVGAPAEANGQDAAPSHGGLGTPTPSAKQGDHSTPRQEASPFRSVKARWLSSFRLESSKKEELKKIIADVKPIPIKMEMHAVKTEKPLPATTAPNAVMENGAQKQSTVVSIPSAPSEVKSEVVAAGTAPPDDAA